MNILKQIFQNRLLVLTTIGPTALTIIYFGLIASDVYVSESRFVVRSPERQSASPLGLILKGAAFSKAQDDSYAVQDYVMSRDALHALDKDLKVVENYSSSKIDLISRFAALDWDDSFEAFYQYFQRKLSMQVDSSSSISTLSVRAFSPEIAHNVNQRLVELAEELVNKLNERGRQDMIQYALHEVRQAENEAKTAAIALAAYRNENLVIDPEKQSTIPLQQVGRLEEELLANRAQLAQLQLLAKDNPQIPPLKQRISLLEREIQNETHRVAGGKTSLAGKAKDYQRLLLERDFADKALASALSSLEQARNEAQRKQLYIERIVQPSFPDKATEPRRFKMVVAVFLCGLIAWGVLSMLIAGIKEHQD